ncbi:hypothetical protein EAI_12593 [Harpegnathos saltator]|uniref:Uncharacterized protein n=1 Tax=Harpegnathos saltator TaxID=610380 RepID=E2BAJ4_HARSA|nr:hypothetical protein EAI_12593 [Harpegnathos saltator]
MCQCHNGEQQPGMLGRESRLEDVKRQDAGTHHIFPSFISLRLCVDLYWGECESFDGLLKDVTRSSFMATLADIPGGEK